MQLRIRELREERNMTQNDLGNLLGTTGVSVGRYEKEPGRVTVPLLEQIAKALNCHVADLIGVDRPSERSVIVLPVRGQPKSMALDYEVAESLGDTTTLQAVEIEDDAMLPTMGRGDMCVIDRSVNAVTKDGIYIIDVDSMTLIQRIAYNPIKRTMFISSDSPLHAPLGEAQPGDVKIAGRVVWTSRRHEAGSPAKPR
jgi:transcriptional regulator with XRE-family HTH domain